MQDELIRAPFGVSLHPASAPPPGRIGRPPLVAPSTSPAQTPPEAEESNAAKAKTKPGAKPSKDAQAKEPDPSRENMAQRRTGPPAHAGNVEPRVPDSQRNPDPPPMPALPVSLARSSPERPTAPKTYRPAGVTANGPLSAAEEGRLLKQFKWTLFSDLGELDRHDRIYAEADQAGGGARKALGGDRLPGDPLRRRAANAYFLADAYQLPVAQVQRNYDYLSHRYAHDTWGSTRRLTVDGFYKAAREEVLKERDEWKADLDARKAGVRAATLTASKLIAVREWQAANPQAGAARIRAFVSAYDDTQSVLKPWRPLIADTLQAAQLLERRSGLPDAAYTAAKEKVDVMIDTLADMPEHERAIMLRSLAISATNMGAQHGQRGAAGTFSAAAFRTLEDMYSKSERVPPSLEAQLMKGHTTHVGTISSLEDAYAAISTDLKDRRHDGIRTRHNALGSLRSLTTEEQKIVNAALERERQRERVYLQLGAIGRATDPLDDSFLGTMASGTGSSVPLLLTGLFGPQGFLAAATGYANADYKQLLMEHADITREAAADTALISGLLKAGVDKLQLFGLKKLAPNVTRVLSGQATRQVLTSTALQGTATFGYQQVQEGVQDLTLPTVQHLLGALRQDVPGVDWDETMTKFWNSRLDVAIGSIPLTFLAVGRNTLTNTDSVLRILQDGDLLGANGITEVHRKQIQEDVQAGDAEAAQKHLQEAWQHRDPAVAAEFQEKIDSSQPENGVAAAIPPTDQLENTQTHDNLEHYDSGAETKNEGSPSGLEKLSQLFRSLPADGGSAEDGRSDSPSSERDRATAFQWQELRKWAGDQNLILPSDFAPPNRLGGAEHDVRHEEATGLWWKYTNPGFSGFTVEWDGESQPSMRMATPMEYVARLLAHNESFGDDIRLRGLWYDREYRDWRIVITQPDVKGKPPTPDQLHEAMTDAGYELLPYADVGRQGAFAYRKGSELVWDVHPSNATLTEDGVIAPYDFIITTAPPLAAPENEGNQAKDSANNVEPNSGQN